MNWNSPENARKVSILARPPLGQALPRQQPLKQYKHFAYAFLSFAFSDSPLNHAATAGPSSTRYRLGVHEGHVKGAWRSLLKAPCRTLPGPTIRRRFSMFRV